MTLQHKLLFFALGILQIFTAVAALICGFLFMIAPDGRYIGAPLKILAATPFSDFLIPGIILFAVNGLGQLAAGFLTFRRLAATGIAGGIFGLGLMIWIFVQVNMIGGRDGLQYAFFIIGLVEVTLAFFADRLLRQ